jgi:hypothetical protein
MHDKLLRYLRKIHSAVAVFKVKAAWFSRVFLSVTSRNQVELPWVVLNAAVGCRRLCHGQGFNAGLAPHAPQAPSGCPTAHCSIGNDEAQGMNLAMDRRSSQVATLPVVASARYSKSRGGTRVFQHMLQPRLVLPGLHDAIVQNVVRHG